MFKRLVGDRAFYKKVLAVSVPLMVQNLVTNFVNVLDNIMVGRLGTEAMSGVTIVNQFVFVFELLIFGAISGAGIFTAQFHGMKDNDGVRSTFRVKFLVSAAAAILAIVVMVTLRSPLIRLYLHEGSADSDIALAFGNGEDYLLVVVCGLLPYAVSQVYASTLRETGQTFVPMVSSVAAVATNCILNFLLIFGHFGLPALGVRGAALATVISRFVEFSILVIYTHSHRARHPFIVGAYRSFRIPGSLVRSIALKGLPLMLNEFFWSLAITIRNQCYSTRGLDAVAAMNIAFTYTNLFAVVYLALGQAVAILTGNLLGAGKAQQAIDDSRKLRAFAVFCGGVTGILLAVASPFIPLMYNTSDTVREIAGAILRVFAFMMPFLAYSNSTYFTIRSGGRVWVTVLFDSVYMWSIAVPVAFLLSRLTGMSMQMLYACCEFSEIFKTFFGFYLVRKTNWAHRLVSADPAA